MRPGFLLRPRMPRFRDRRVHRPTKAGLALHGRSKPCGGWLLSPIAREQDNMLPVDDAEYICDNQNVPRPSDDGSNMVKSIATTSNGCVAIRRPRGVRSICG